MRKLGLDRGEGWTQAGLLSVLPVLLKHGQSPQVLVVSWGVIIRRGRHTLFLSHSLSKCPRNACATVTPHVYSECSIIEGIAALAVNTAVCQVRFHVQVAGVLHLCGSVHVCACFQLCLPDCAVCVSVWMRVFGYCTCLRVLHAFALCMCVFVALCVTEVMPVGCVLCVHRCLCVLVFTYLLHACYVCAPVHNCKCVYV